MTVRPILTVGHPVLREPAREVTAEELAGPEVQLASCVTFGVGG